MKIYLQGDVEKCTQWTTTLVAKMKESCDFEFHARRNHRTDESAMMSVINSDFQPRPKVILGYVWSVHDNVYGVLALMHELGHVIDYKKFKHSLSLYWRTLGVYEMEVRAWENAFRLARQVGFHDFQLMRDFSIECLKTYFDPCSSSLSKDHYFGYKGTNITLSEAIERMDMAQRDAERAVKEALYGL